MQPADCEMLELDCSANARQTSKADENSRTGDSRAVSLTSRLYNLKFFNFSYYEIPALPDNI